MKILHLTLKKKWFDMIASGEKKEEYREIKPYWVRRLTDSKRLAVENLHKTVSGTTKTMFEIWKKEFDIVRFKNGYAKNAPVMDVEFKDTKIDGGCGDWGAEPFEEYFVIKLGKIIKYTNPLNS